MAIVPLPLPPGAEARALLHHLLEHGDIVGEDATGRTIVQLALDDWVLEKLMGFGADGAELEDGSDTEPDEDAEEDWLPVVLDVVRPKVIRRRRPLTLVSGTARLSHGAEGYDPAQGPRQDRSERAVGRRRY